MSSRISGPEDGRPPRVTLSRDESHRTQPARRWLVPLAVAAALLGAIALDYAAPWPYVMTPLYAIPVLIAAWWLPLSVVAVTTALVTAVNVISSSIQGTPLAVWVLDTCGLVLTSCLAMLLARQGRLTANYAAEAARRAREAEAARRRLQELLGIAAHDMRNSLASIKTSAGGLRQDGAALPDGARRNLAEAVEEEADRLRRFVDNVLDLRRLEAGALRPDRERYPLDAVVDEVLHQLRATTTHHRVIVDVPETLPPVPLDFVQISHALLNLVENAVKYAPRGSAIVVAARVGVGAVRVSVTDDGPGIPPRALPHVLDPFYRVAGTAARAAAQTSGTGLGLAVVRGLVEAHGGTVGVQSPPPGYAHGTAVTFDLPLHPLDTALPTAITSPMMTSPLPAAAWAVPAGQADQGG